MEIRSFDPSVRSAAVNTVPERSEQPRIPESKDSKITKSETVDKGVLEEAVKKANDIFHVLNTAVEFRIHDQTGRYYVSIINTETNEVVREIPAKKHLDMVAAMEKLMKGIFIDESK